MFLEVFFHFFGCRLSDNTNTVVVDRNFLIALAVFVFRCGYHDFLNKFVYQFRCEDSRRVICFALSINFCKPSVLILAFSSSISKAGIRSFNSLCSFFGTST